MTYCRLCAVLVVGALLSLLSACDDPSSVGLGVGDDELEGGVPSSSQAIASDLSTFTRPPVTGNANTDLRWRMLAGTVDDPLTGRLDADGYIDFRSALLTDGIRTADASDLTASLVLERTFVHGDTTSSVSFDVFDLASEIDMGGVRSDSSFLAVPTPIDSYTYAAEDDTLAVFDLPQRWIDRNVDVLQDTTSGGDAFEDAFHGFKIVPTGGNAVFGFDQGSASLRLTAPNADDDADRDTVFVRVAKVFTNVRQQSPPSVTPSDRVVLIDGIGVRAEFDIDFGAPPLDTLENASVNRAELIVPIDTTGLKETPPNFVRPYEEARYRLTADTTGAAPRCETVPGVVRLQSEEALSNCEIGVLLGAAPSNALVSNDIALPLMQASLLEGQLLTRYRLSISTLPPNTQGLGRVSGDLVRLGQPSTLPILIPSLDATDLTPPRLTFTVTPL